MSCYDNYNRKLNSLCYDARNKNLECLTKILCDNKDTAFGREHHFDSIHSLEEYRRCVPISEYEYFEKYAIDEFEGKKNRLTSYNIYSFCKSSGSSGNSKLVPVTTEAMNKDIHLLNELENDILNEYGGKRLRINLCRTNPAEKVEKTLLFSEIWFRHGYENGIIDINDFVGGYGLIFRKDLNNYHYPIIWAALIEEDVTILDSIFLYDALRFFEYLGKYYDKILNDLEKGEPDESLGLSKEIIDHIRKIHISNERLAFLRKEFSKGLLGIAERIWPNLKVCIGISGSAFLVEESAVRQYLGNIPIFVFAYASSEAVMGFPVKENEYSYILIPGNLFFEFSQIDGTDGKTLLIDELTVGETYEVIITNFSGLYRYRLNDIVKCTGYRGDCPIVEFATRKNQALNLAGEKVSMTQVEQVVMNLRKEGICTKEYSFFADISDSPYRYMGVVSVDDAVFDEKNGEKFIDISQKVDLGFRLINPDYDDLRNMGDLEKPMIIGVKCNTYRDFVKFLYYDYMGENKPVHVLRQALYARACEWEKSLIGKDANDE